MDTAKVFVYGTLKANEDNSLLKWDSDFISEDAIVGFELYTLGLFPAICVSETDKRSLVYGETWKVSEEVIHVMDTIEGYKGKDNPSNLYDRVKGTTLLGEDVWVYVMDRRKIIESFSFDRVDNGVWNSN